MAFTIDRTALSITEASALSQSSKTPQLPLTTRLYYAFRLWNFKLLVWTVVRILRLYHNSRFSDLGPDLTKYYSVRPTLETRIYYPKSHSPSSNNTTKLPLYLNIHGGGFALCDPAVDDHFCRPWANKHNFLVVSLNYRKTPLHAFPTQVHDVAALIRAVLDDTTLPIDYSRIIMGGFSAGGNLTLAAAQFPDIRARIKALIPIYPVVDFSGRYKGAFRTTKDGRPDMLKGSSSWFTWGYLNPGTDQTDPLLSVIYASKQDLPDKIFFVGAEYDVLCHEAEIMAKKLAGYAPDAPTGPKWERNGVKWRMFWDMRHGFTHAPEKGEYEFERKEACDVLYREMAEWIYKDVFGAEDLIDLS